MSTGIKEIERKFVVEARGFRPRETRYYEQAYLVVGPTEVRVRRQLASGNSEAVLPGSYRLAVKVGLGYVRDEVEMTIPDAQGQQLFELARDVSVRKARHALGEGWVLDELLGRHTGLWLLEIEQEEEDAPLPEVPDGIFIVSDVTDSPEWKTQRLALYSQRWQVLDALAACYARNGL